MITTCRFESTCRGSPPCLPVIMWYMGVLVVRCCSGRHGGLPLRVTAIAPIIATTPYPSSPEEGTTLGATCLKRADTGVCPYGLRRQAKLSTLNSQLSTINDVVRREQERDGDDDEEGDVGEAGARQGEEMADEGRGVDDEQS